MEFDNDSKATSEVLSPIETSSVSSFRQEMIANLSEFLSLAETLGISGLQLEAITELPKYGLDDVQTQSLVEMLPALVELLPFAVKFMSTLDNEFWQYLESFVENMSPDMLPDMQEITMTLAEFLPLLFGVLSAFDNEQWQVAEDLIEKMLLSLEEAKGLQAYVVLYQLYLGATKNILGKYEEALTILAGITGLSSDLRLLRALQEDINATPFSQIIKPILGAYMHQIVAQAYILLAVTATFIEKIPLSRLYATLNDGFAFIKQTGQTELEYIVHAIHANFYSAEGRKEEALDEALLALAKKKDGKNQSLSTSTRYFFTESTREQLLNVVASYLIDLERYDEAMPYLEEVLATVETSPQVHEAAYRLRGYVYLHKEYFELAEDAANKALRSAQQNKNTESQGWSYQLLSLTFARQGRIQEASQAAARLWFVLRRSADVYDTYFIYRSCGKVRLAQARKQLKQSTKIGEEILETRSVETSSQDRKDARHFAHSAIKWLTLAHKIAIKLDARTTNHHNQEEIDPLMLEATKLAKLAIEPIN